MAAGDVPLIRCAVYNGARLWVALGDGWACLSVHLSGCPAPAIGATCGRPACTNIVPGQNVEASVHPAVCVALLRGLIRSKAGLLCRTPAACLVRTVSFHLGFFCWGPPIGASRLFAYPAQAKPSQHNAHF